MTQHKLFKIFRVAARNYTNFSEEFNEKKKLKKINE